MTKRKVSIAIALGMALSTPYVVDTTVIRAVVDNSEATSAPAHITIKTGVPSAQVQIAINCTSDPSIETQTQTATADDTGRVTVRYDRVKGMTYTISLTVNCSLYTMTDDKWYESTCDTLTVEGIRAGLDAEGQQTLTVDISLADVPETPEPDPVEPEPEKPEPKTPEKEDDTPKEDVKAHEKSTERPSAKLQKAEASSAIAQGMPTGYQPWNPIAQFFTLIRVCL